MIHYFSGKLRVELKGPSTRKLIFKWETVVLRVGARNRQEGRKPGGNETWPEANGLEAEEEEGVEGKGSGRTEGERTRRADCLSEEPWSALFQAERMYAKGSSRRPPYILGVWEGPSYSVGLVQR